MALLPFDPYRLPGCDPDHHEIRKDERGYVIGWAPIECWGNPIIFSSLREMAKDLIKRHSSLLDLQEEYRQKHSFVFDNSSMGFYGIVKIEWRPQVKCAADERAEFKIDKEKFLEELTEELKSVSKLLPFI